MKYYQNVFDALEDDPVVAENLKIRAELMMTIENYIEKSGITQEKAAEIMNVSQPRISDLVRGKIDKFTIDMLINMLSNAGIYVKFELKKAA